MIQLIMNDVTYSLSTSLRVVYELRNITNAKTLQDAVNSISRLDLDAQMSLIYAAYKAGNKGDTTLITKNEFIDMLLDTQGIIALGEIVNKLADGLMYSGLTPEETEAKKAQVEKQLLGTASSAKDIG